MSAGHRVVASELANDLDLSQSLGLFAFAKTAYVVNAIRRMELTCFERVLSIGVYVLPSLAFFLSARIASDHTGQDIPYI